MLRSLAQFALVSLLLFATPVATFAAVPAYALSSHATALTVPTAETNTLADFSGGRVSNGRFVQAQQAFNQAAHVQNLNEFLPQITALLEKLNDADPVAKAAAEKELNSLRDEFIKKGTPLFEKTVDQFRIWDLTKPGKSIVVPTKTPQAQVTYWTLTPTHILWESTQPVPEGSSGIGETSIRSYSFATGKEDLVYTESSANGGPIDRIIAQSTAGQFNTATFEIENGVEPHARHKATYLWNIKKGSWEYKEVTFSGPAKGFTFSEKRVTGPTAIKGGEFTTDYPTMGSTYAVHPALNYAKKTSQLAWVNLQNNKRGTVAIPFLLTGDTRKSTVASTKNQISGYATDMKIYGDRVLILRMIPVMKGPSLDETKSISELWTYTFSTNKVQRILKLEGFFDRIESFEADEAMLASTVYPTARAFTHIVLKGTPRQDYTITRKEIEKHKGSKNILGYSRGAFILADSPFGSADAKQPDFSKMSAGQLEQFALDVLMAPRVHMSILKK